MLTRHTLTRFAIAVCSIAFSACTSYELVDDGSVTYQPLRIVTAASPIEVEAPLVAQELINTYTLVFINTTTHRVEAIRSVDKHLEAVEYDQISFPIEISEQGSVDQHSYKVYAFANFTDEMKGNAVIDGTINEEENTIENPVKLSELAEGMVLSEDYEKVIAESILDLSNLNGHDFTKGSQYIPMTAVVDYKATMQYHQPFNVPLVRMLAKVNFQLRNNTCGENPLRLYKISIRPIQNAPVYLLPHLKGQNVGFYPKYPDADNNQYGQAGTATNGRAYSYVPDVPKAPKEKTDTTHVTLDLRTTDKGYVEIPKNGDVVNVGSIYVNESLAKWHPTEHFTYDLYFTDSDDGPHEYRYALSADDFTAFCRNDNVTIPLTITSPSSLEPEVLFYPPIGGYPPVVSDKDDDEFYATFATGGDFAIYPHIWREGQRTSIRLTDADKVEFSVDDDHATTGCQYQHLTITGDAIFSEAPTYSAADNCIKATLTGDAGHAIITLTVRMLDSNEIVRKHMHILCQ